MAAARILCHSNELDLGGRVEYLSRAVMCVKSSEGGGAASRAAGELEEKMEMAGAAADAGGCLGEERRINSALPLVRR